MKTIFITVAEATPACNILRGTFLRTFAPDKKIKIVLVTTREKLDAYAKEFSGEFIVVEAISQIEATISDRILAFISRNALRTGTTQFNQMRQYHDGGSFLALLIKRTISIVFGRSHTLQSIIRKIELKRKASWEVSALYEKYQPTGVFSTVSINAEVDVPVLREAKRRQILTVGMLRGWDNFTTHGFLRVVPDRMMVQNQYLKEMGMKYQFLDSVILEVVGFPQNDWYFRKEWIQPREQFLKNWGLDPKKRVILFGAMGDFLFPKEGEIAEVFEELVNAGQLPGDVVMVFRAHPAFASPLERMKTMKYVVPDRNAVYASSLVSSWEMGEGEMAYLLNSIIHSDMVVTAGSTMALDGIALGKPVIMTAFEKTPTPYWVSAKRFLHHYTHYEALLKTGGMRLAQNPEEFATAITQYMHDPKLDLAGREMAKDLFLAPFDGYSGVRIAHMLQEHFEL